MMESDNSKPSKKVMNKPGLTSFKKALAFSLSKKGAKGFQAKAEPRKIRAQNRPTPGVMFISHLPHGFFEKEIRAYFTQFGVVTGLSLPRSKRTGRTRGHAFIKFMDGEVAEIAVKTMNNYLMCNRILKACLLTPARGMKVKFPSKHRPLVTPETCARARNRTKFITNRNSTQSKIQHEQMILEEHAKLKKTQKKLTGLGLPEVDL